MKEEFEEIEGIKCKIKDPSKKGTVRACQNNLREEIDKYLGSNVMNDKKQGYVDVLEINLRSLPFTLGWLEWPASENDKQIIKGRVKPVEIAPTKKTKALPKKTKADKK